MAWAKLNVFQRLVRQWDALHPYNAAQFMLLAGAADPARLEGAWRETLCDLGLGRLNSAPGRYRFESVNGDVEMYGVARVRSRQAGLEAHITSELNRRFAPDEYPLRPFVIDGEDGSHHVGVVYHHWVADSASIRLLLREWFYRAYDPPRARRAPLRVGAEGYWRAFGPGCALFRRQVST